jgi:hypothetical protein
MKPYKIGENRQPADQKIPAKLEGMISAVLKYIEATAKDQQQEERSSI